MTKESSCVVLVIAVFVVSVCYAAAVFGWYAKANEHMRTKVAAVSDLTAQLSAVSETLEQLQSDTRHLKQQYETWLHQTSQHNCANGAYAEIIMLADKHDIHIRKMERQPVEKTLLPQSQQPWFRIQTAFSMIGSWDDYLRFRSALAASPCLLQSISEHARAGDDIFSIAVDLSLFVLQPQAAVSASL